MYTQIRERLTVEVFNKVSEQILTKSAENQIAIQDRLIERLNEWDNTIKKRVKEILAEERGEFEKSD